tara:strand:+ start:127 stop:234 length:108 start_codon:yes stop_codon:yes gene_type:complete
MEGKGAGELNFLSKACDYWVGSDQKMSQVNKSGVL